MLSSPRAPLPRNPEHVATIVSRVLDHRSLTIAAVNAVARHLEATRTALTVTGVGYAIVDQDGTVTHRAPTWRDLADQLTGGHA